MGALDKIKDFLNPNYDNEEDYDMVDDVQDEEKITAFKPKMFSSNNSDNFRKNDSNSFSKDTKVLVYEPKNYSEAVNIVDSLKNKKIVVVNFRNMESCEDKSPYDCQKEAFDFINGAVYAIEGHIEKISSTIFVIVPPGVDIDTNIKQEPDKKGNRRWAI